MRCLGEVLLAVVACVPTVCAGPLACKVHSIAPRLTYRMAYRAGFVVSTPLSQVDPQAARLRLIVRITPKQEGGRPLILKDTWTLPGETMDGRHAPKADIEIRDEFYLGVGEYRAEMELSDERQRVCRKSWDLALKPAGPPSTALEPGQLAASSELDWPRPGPRPGRLTVFLNAGSRRDDQTLLASLAGIVESLPFRELQVVAFSLEGRKELLRKEVREARDFSEVAKALRESNPSTVSYDTLQERTGYSDFLSRLLAAQSLHSERPGVNLFLGFPTFDDSHLAAPPECRAGSGTVYAYLLYPAPPLERRALPPAGRPLPERSTDQERAIESRQATLSDEYMQMHPAIGSPDAISRLTRACSGKVFYIHSPADLAAALAKVQE